MHKWIIIFVTLLIIGGVSIGMMNFSGVEKYPKFVLIDEFDSTKTVTNDDLKGKTYAINIFMSLCKACEDELPALKYLKGYVPVYGISWLDTADRLADFINDNDNPFDILHRDGDGTLVQKTFGINLVPITYVIDASGKIIYSHEGEITEEIVDKDILPLITSSD